MELSEVDLAESDQSLRTQHGEDGKSDGSAMTRRRTERELRIEVVKSVLSLFQKGLIGGTGGNVSARLPDQNEVLMTPSGFYKARLTQSDLVKIDVKGNLLEGSSRPSVEWRFHTAIYRSRSDVNAVIHSHSPVATGLALAGVKVGPVTYEAAVVLGKVPILPFLPPGTDELAEAVANKIGRNPVVILKNHGPVAVGRSLLEAMSRIEVLEECATMIFVASHFGRARALSQSEINLARRKMQSIGV